MTKKLIPLDFYDLRDFLVDLREQYHKKKNKRLSVNHVASKICKRYGVWAEEISQ